MRCAPTPTSRSSPVPRRCHSTPTAPCSTWAIPAAGSLALRSVSSRWRATSVAGRTSADLDFLRRLYDLSGQVAVVTGGTGVLGGEMARGLAEAGARVAVLGRRAAQGQAVVEKIVNAGGEGLALQADVNDAAQLERARDQLLERWGQLDILVNAAGGNMPAATVPPGASVFGLGLDAVQEVFNLNLMGTVRASIV